MRVFCITQARMGSSRLPNKVMMPLGGQTLIDCHMQRVALSTCVDTHILATSNHVSDDRLASHALSANYTLFRGDEANVLQRFYAASEHFQAQAEDLIVRLTGDCPLICPRLIDQVIAQHLRQKDHAYSHLSLAYWARGLDVEVFSKAILDEAYHSASTAMDFEHVTYYIYNHPNMFNIHPVEGGNKHWAKHRICVDESPDFELVEAIIARLGYKWPQATGEDICRLLDDNPELTKINQGVRQRQAHS